MIAYKNRRVPETFEEIVDPNHTVLLVHEMRNDLREIGAPDKNGQMIRIEFDPIVEPIRRLVESARRRSVRILYAGYVGHSDENFYSDPMVLRSRDRLLDPATAPGPSGEVETTRGWQVIDELRPQKGDIILRKPRVDCFIGTNLKLVLRWNAIRTVVIVGVGAEIGILLSSRLRTASARPHESGMTTR